MRGRGKAIRGVDVGTGNIQRFIEKLVFLNQIIRIRKAMNKIETDLWNRASVYIYTERETLLLTFPIGSLTSGACDARGWLFGTSTSPLP